MGGGKKAMNKMETRIRELESEIDAESRRMADGQKNLRKSERRIKEQTYASDEDRRTMSARKLSLINCNPRSSLTRSRLRKLKRSLPLTLPSSAMLMLNWQMLKKGLISTSKLWLSPRLRLVEHLLELCKKMLLRSCR